VLRGVLGDTAEVRLEDVVAVQEGKLAGGLDPDLGVSSESEKLGGREVGRRTCVRG